jgi:hypothetical protein
MKFICFPIVAISELFEESCKSAGFIHDQPLKTETKSDFVLSGRYPITGITRPRSLF